MKRHPDISTRTSQNLTVQRRAVKQKELENWFQDIKDYVAEKSLESALKDPTRVFNCDETAFFLNPKPGKVLVERGSKTVYTAAGADEKSNLTVLITANAAGAVANPMVVFRYVRIPQMIASAMPTNWAIGRSENGWMTHETFYEYMVNIFEPWLTTNNIQQPVLFFMDGHSSHISLPLANFCLNKKIELISLLPNATHLIQPMDVAVFHTLKASWKQEVAEWRMANEGKQVEKHNFPSILDKVLGKLAATTIKNGFKACGLVPWNPSIVKIPEISKPPIQHITQSRSDSDSKILEAVETKIGSIKLEAFKENIGEWSGDIKDFSLYYLWFSMKNSVEGALETAEQQNIEMATVAGPSTVVDPSTVVGPPTLVDPSNVAGPSVVARPSTIIEPSTVAGPSSAKALSSPEVTNNTVPDPLVPSPFKRTLIWPAESTEPSKRRKREKLLAVVTSPQMLAYFAKKEEIKKKTEEAKQKRKDARETKKKEILEKREEKRKAKEKEIESSSCSSSSVSYAESDKSLILSEESDNECVPLNLTDIKEGDFIIGQFVGGKRGATIYKYLCVVQQRGPAPQDLVVQGLRSLDDNKNSFVVVDNDISTMNTSQVIAVVPAPDVINKDRHIIYKFKKRLDVREK